jgi:hypothetical protein
LTPITHSQSFSAHASVVEDEVGYAKALHGGGSQRLDLSGLGHVQPEGQHLGTQTLDLGLRCGQSVGLHIGHDQLHAQTRRNAAALQPKARGRARDDGYAALKMAHAFSCLI